MSEADAMALLHEKNQALTELKAERSARASETSLLRAELREERNLAYLTGPAVQLDALLASYAGSWSES